MHPLGRPHLPSLLTSLGFWVSSATFLSCAAATQTFEYMIKNGLEFGCLTNGRVKVVWLGLARTLISYRLSTTLPVTTSNRGQGGFHDS
ncbi:hypothetical protein P168DRAFT_287246 [Aspergillus campestris IBT 28561]|uniref:Secreted protein n=1 Tax=Aspergillus campestris (strain IBT 28561) TaxID=1392248 RepID=A0A2I1DH20_ASPC2|nr:uncharacterized protein P168DRAFT_287246 [Aspergillus campestris IBT 28561]PKY09171.1 hypothetical protein P168DRAFT_287246 [Aspergillus campestris IBT 28561]